MITRLWEVLAFLVRPACACEGCSHACVSAVLSLVGSCLRLGHDGGDTVEQANFRQLSHRFRPTGERDERDA
ncbi:hypothetical protein EDB92DRAFT_1905099 [Lactarius akahatsu]|uniref:Secreted protein n=1 Tax=Lactarius akahatsu TaxID=416441 RepID=A0AAD4L9D9_9AGAM|nr:hypothetical protein EDB92DRAFT_1905099 [Lactarius akahatsu]